MFTPWTLGGQCIGELGKDDQPCPLRGSGAGRELQMRLVDN